MTNAQMRADIEVLMTRLVQTERALLDTRQQVAAVPKVTALLVDTKTIGKALTFNGEHKDWPEWSFQFNSHILKSRAQVRTMLFDYCRAEADTACGDAVPMEL